MNGILSINKPAGMTSREAVDLVSSAIHRRGTRQRARMKIGHAGTLDPLATGVLLICMRSATRLVPVLHEPPKVYHAQFRLGETSDTDDNEGHVLKHAVSFPSREEIDALLPEFVGCIMQRPPSYSALQVGGRRAYALAREQQSVELSPRSVSVHRLALLNYAPPVLEIEVECGSGTYIRSLARDLGERLGTGGLMSGLARVSIGPFHIRDALSISADVKLEREQVTDRLQPLTTGVSHLPILVVSQAEAHLVRNGGRLAWTSQRQTVVQPPTVQWPLIGTGELLSEDRVAIVEEAGDLAAIAEIQGGHRLQPRITFPA